MRKKPETQIVTSKNVFLKWKKLGEKLKYDDIQILTFTFCNFSYHCYDVIPILKNDFSYHFYVTFLVIISWAHLYVLFYLF
jgi:hypothetical protein